MKKCSMSCLCSGTNRSTGHFEDYLAINDNELTLSVTLMYPCSPLPPWTPSLPHVVQCFPLSFEPTNRPIPLKHTHSLWHLFFNIKGRPTHYCSVPTTKINRHFSVFCNSSELSAALWKYLPCTNYCYVTFKSNFT